VQLNRSRRTSRPIATFAFNVLLGRAAESATQTAARGFVDLPSLRDDDLVIETDAGFSIELAQRPGPAPELWISTDAENEIDDVVTRIGDLTRAEDVRPEEILVQTASQWEYLEPLRNALEAQDIRTHWVLDAKDELITQPGRVTLSTIQSAKGYDAPVVFVVGAQELGTDLESRARFYVGATRAQLLLVVTGHGEPAALLGEMKEVRRRLPALQPQVGCVVAPGSQLFNDALSHSHVRKKAHGEGSARHHAFLSQPRRVLERLVHVLAFQVRVFAQYLFHGRAVGDLSNDDRDRDTHAANAGATTENPGVECDSLEHVRPSSVLLQPRFLQSYRSAGRAQRGARSGARARASSTARA